MITLHWWYCSDR